MSSTSRVAVVTGAAQGIGRRVAEVLAEEGYALALTDLREAGLTIAAVRQRGRDALDFQGDVSVQADVAAFTEHVRDRFGRADVLVNNAGISFIAPAEETAAEQWRRVLEVNLTGPFLLSQSFGRMMLEAGAGSIVNIASITGLAGVADRAAYNASKHGLVGLTRTLAAEWGGRGVRVNAVCPGWVKTEMDVEDQAAGGYRDSDIVEQVPMGRFAAPNEIAGGNASRKSR
jgi:NAD(P)-dependent dehydrogenase (short-subunit alcohol dehydrogenase family)